jgi:hypothetical protein
VEDGERVYRGVKKKDAPDGKISAEAFKDPQCRPSVDRAACCGNNPSYTKVKEIKGVTVEYDYVLNLLAGNVRNLDPVPAYDHKARPVGEHQLCIEAVPLDTNPAHAEIYGNPEIRGSTFKRVKEALAKIASWEEGLSP